MWEDAIVTQSTRALLEAWTALTCPVPYASILFILLTPFGPPGILLVLYVEKNVCSFKNDSHYYIGFK